MSSHIAKENHGRSGGDAINVPMPDERIPTKTSPSPKHEKLPNELLANIFKYLQSIRPVSTEDRIHNQPVLGITDSSVKDLKNAASVCKKWRNVILPKLFKHARFIADVGGPDGFDLLERMKPFFELVIEQKLSLEISTFTLLVKNTDTSNALKAFKEPMTKLWTVFFQNINPVELLIVAPPAALGVLTACHVNLEHAEFFDCPYHYLELRQPGSLRMPSEQVKNWESTVVDAPTYRVPTHPSSLVDEPKTERSHSHNQVAQTMPRSEATVSLAAPQVDDVSKHMASKINSGASATASADSSSDSPTNSQSTLFSIRPWSILLLNEGSFIKALSSRSPVGCSTPSILQNLLGSTTLSIPALISPTIRDFSYVAIFPLLAHFTQLTTSYPRLHALYVQMAPRNNITNDPSQMFDVDESDLWMERNSAYAAVMRDVMEFPVVKPALKDLKSFESGDCADKDAWSMAVEYVRRANTARPVGDRWVVVRDGVFSRGGQKE